MGSKETFSILQKTKGRYKLKITFFLLIIVFGFLLTFVPLNKLGINVTDQNMWSILIKITSSSVLSLLIRVPLFTTDPLATGSGKESYFFRKLYPSETIKNKYNIEEGEAKNIWFDFFNNCCNQDNRYHSHWKTTFERTYSCRFIYYVCKLLFFASLISFGIIICYLITNCYYPNFFLIDIKMIGYSILVLLTFLFLSLGNRIGNEKKEPSGCWYKYREISEIFQSILKNEILDKASTFQEAREIVNKLYKCK